MPRIHTGVRWRAVVSRAFLSFFALKRRRSFMLLKRSALARRLPNLTLNQWNSETKHFLRGALVEARASVEGMAFTFVVK